MEVNAVFWLTLFATVATYWALPRGRDAFLTLMSAAYLTWLSPWAAILPCGWCVVFYLLGPKIRIGNTQSRRVLAVLLASILAYLAFFKYVPALTAFVRDYLGVNGPTLEILFPLGISYYTFKLIHYAIEVSRGNIPEHPTHILLLYLLMFTIFPAGPIERFDHFLANRQETWHPQLFGEGMTRIIYGLIKKFCIAENVIMPIVSWHGQSTSEVMRHLDVLPVSIVWIHVGLWFLYFYLDFSAYSDIAIGASRLFGFRIQENFNYPLMAVHIGDFWQRWHMSLAAWCRAYVYMPLIGVTRNPYLAVYASLLTLALWHKASLSWLLWGFYHATGLAIFQAWLRLKSRWKFKVPEHLLVKTISRCGTLAFVTASYAFLVTAPTGAYSGVRLFAKLFAINLPA